jgi:hypothetical protein
MARRQHQHKRAQDLHLRHCLMAASPSHTTLDARWLDATLCIDIGNILVRIKGGRKSPSISKQRHPWCHLISLSSEGLLRHTPRSFDGTRSIFWFTGTDLLVCLPLPFFFCGHFSPHTLFSSRGVGVRCLTISFLERALGAGHFSAWLIRKAAEFLIGSAITPHISKANHTWTTHTFQAASSSPPTSQPIMS